MKILFTGDIAFNAIDVVEKNPFSDMNKSFYQNIDATIISFDSSIGLQTKSTKVGPKISANSEMLEFFKIFPSPILNLATNHFQDSVITEIENFVILQTIGGIDIIGAGENIHEASEGLTLESGTDKVLILATATETCSPGRFATDGLPGILGFDLEYLCSIANDYRSRGYKIVLCIHWGRELLAYPTPDEVEIGKKLVEHFDLVIGNHPHVIRGKYSRGRNHIFFSLGNTLFGDITSEDNKVIFKLAPENKIGALIVWDSLNKTPNNYQVLSISNLLDKVSVDKKNKAKNIMFTRSKLLKINIKIYRIMYYLYETIFNIFIYRFAFRFQALGLRASLFFLIRKYFKK